MTVYTLMPVASHLWQSTMFAAVIVLLAFMLRRHQAQTRYWLWLAASLKFALPFSWIIRVGQLVEWRSPATPVPPQMMAVVERISEPFALTLAYGGGIERANLWAPILLGVWLLGTIAVLVRWFVNWRRLYRAKCGAQAFEVGLSIPVLVTSSAMEPGVFGLIHPVLLVPAGIDSSLTPGQLDAIFAHELCHVRRRDNLAAAFHMAIEAAFWFHPLVWWIGRRLVEERENACDQEVLLAGKPPHVYAESILSVCKYYLESPLPCAAGVTGADLMKRIETIMTSHKFPELSTARKCLLAGVAIAALVTPLVIGVATAPQLKAQGSPNFEVASIKPSNPDSRGIRFQFVPGGGMSISGAPLRELIMFAYDIRQFQMVGGPSWIDTERYDINAKPPAGGSAPDARSMTAVQREEFQKLVQTRMQNLLAERFQLKVTQQSKELPIYNLIEAKGGAKLKPAGDTKGPNFSVSITMQRGAINADGVEIQHLLKGFGNIVGRPVRDKTGLQGSYDIKLEWTPDSGASGPGGDGPPPPPTDGTGATIFTAIQEQLGLKFEAAKGPVDTYRIDSVQKPTEN